MVKIKDEITPNINVMEGKLERYFSAINQYEANEGQNYMRANAPWTDRTGNARGGLFARPFKEGDHYITVLYGTVPYQIWLEVKNSGEYAIITPSLPIIGNNILSSMHKLLRKL